MMIMLIILSMLPMSIFAEDEKTESPYAAKSFSAFYNSANDSVIFNWIAPENAPYEMWLCSSEKIIKVDAASGEYLYEDADAGENKFYLLSLADANDTEGVKSNEVTVNVAYTVHSIKSFDAVAVKNDATVDDIAKVLPSTAAVEYLEGDEIKVSTGHRVDWFVDGINYDNTLIEEQTVTVKGAVTLSGNVIQNRNDISLVCTVTVKINAAENVSMVTDVQEKYDVKIGDKHSLIIETNGTVSSYQWYKKELGATKATAIKGADGAEYKFKSLKATDSGIYYCVVTGKDGSEVISSEATVNVTKKTYFDKLHSTFIEKNGLNKILSGLGNTLIITAGALIIGVIIGILIAVAKYFSDDVPALKPVAWICDIYVTVIRGIPVTVLLIIFFFIIMATAKNGIIPAILTFGINSGAYMAEIIRSGINAVDKGQMEAGRSLGLSKMQTMTKIVLPQAIRYILPAIGNEFIALLKETSVAGYVAVDDLTRAGQLVSASTYDVVNPRLLVAIIYLAIVVILTQILGYFERRLAKNDKRK
jgi:His/Glu/Gln/Arg/opine family amino acid ABC transporter permease subunit